MAKFKAGRFRKGDKAIRIMEEGDSVWRDKCTIFKITKKFIICEILMASKSEERNVLQQIVFDRKTGINIRGKDWGWLENPKKKKETPAVQKEIQQNQEFHYSCCH
jgi:chromatin remodeling complex protein RSC6